MKSILVVTILATTLSGCALPIRHVMKNCEDLAVKSHKGEKLSACEKQYEIWN